MRFHPVFRPDRSAALPCSAINLSALARSTVNKFAKYATISAFPVFLAMSGGVSPCLFFRLEIGALSNEAFDDIGVSAFRRPV